MGQFWTLSFAFLCSFSAFLTQAMTNETQTYIVGVQNDLKPSEFSDAEEWYSSTLQTLDSGRGGKDLLHVYRTVFHGFSARLTKQQALQLKRRPEILGVLPARVRPIQTTRSPHFLGLMSGSASAPKDLLTMSDFGSNIVIGVIDSGIWPEHPSFRDQGLDSIPSHWKGECLEGEEFSKSLCNKKLVGAWYYTKGDNDKDFPHPRRLKSARDTEGHGSHTASIAGGMHVENASFLGFAQGVAVGIAPKARIAVYKICWEHGFCDADILAGIDKAVDDGVDVLSLSLGSIPSPYDEDVIAIGSFGAMEKGVIVSSSAGNSGPDPSSVGNVAPWMTSVGASTIDRNFPADLILGDGRVINGSSLYKGDPLPKDKYFPLIYARNASYHNTIEAAYCLKNSLDPKLVHGKIVMCEGDVPDYHVLEGEVVKKAGGIGFVVTNMPQEGEDLLPIAYLSPGLIITQSAGNTLRNYIITSKNPKAKIVFRGTRVGVKPAPVVASFSSRGPNRISNYILKPDLIAPGVNILAAWPPDIQPIPIPKDKRRTDFNIVSGTSMACPHVSGLSALLKGAHPDWSPAMIRSALMTTAYTVDSDGKPLLEGVSYKNATVWDMGAGHVNPDKANDPGLVYDLTVDDYVDFLCASGYNQKKIKMITRRTVDCEGKVRKPWNLNYPAISVVFNTSDSSSKLEVLVSRTATQVTEGASNYTATIVNPEGAAVTVDPPQLKFKEKGEKQSYLVRISIKKMDVQQETTAVGKLTWADGEHKVTSPIIVVSKLSEK